MMVRKSGTDNGYMQLNLTLPKHLSRRLTDTIKTGTFCS